MFARKNSAATNSDTKHYKYCTLCGTRNSKANHSSSWSGGGHTDCKTGTYGYEDISDSQHQFHCNDCGYTRAAVAHDTADSASAITVIKYLTADETEVSGENGAAYKDTYKYCSGCGHKISYVRENLHKHAWSYFCGYRHTCTSWTGFSSCTANGTPHCWECGKYKVAKVDENGDAVLDAEGNPVMEIINDCPSHDKARYGCMTCSCGISRYAVTTETDKWCGAHAGIFSKSYIRWCESWGGITNTHCTNTPPNWNYTQTYYG